MDEGQVREIVEDYIRNNLAVQVKCFPETEFRHAEVRVQLWLNGTLISEEYDVITS